MNTFKQRLLNVAIACRQSPKPGMFTMERHMHPCGTAACAFGHYAARGDLQPSFKLLKPIELGGIVRSFEGVATVRGMKVGYDDSPVVEHFGLTSYEIEELFGPEGCGNAQNAIEAAEYIEKFCAQKWPESVDEFERFLARALAAPADEITSAARSEA